MRTFIVAWVGLLGLLAASCHPNNSSPQGTTVRVSVAFAGNDTASFHLGQSFSVFDSSYLLTPTTSDMYLSNFKFYKPDGAVWAEPNSYHLVRMGTKPGASLTFSIPNVPEGPYSKLEFAFGVDSNHNRSLDKTGDLDPINGMAWDWNTGYRFLVLEGSFKAKGGVSQNICWHIGTTDNYRVAQFPLNQTLPVNNLGITIKLPAFFDGYRALSPPLFAKVMFEKDTTALAANNIIRAIEIKQH